MKRLISFFAIFFAVYQSLAQLSAAQWKEDIDYLLYKVKLIHPCVDKFYSPLDLQNWKTKMFQFAEKGNPEEMYAQFAKFLAGFNDGHTMAVPVLNDTSGVIKFSYIPLRLQFFEDGLFITGTQDPGLWGKKVISINGKHANEILQMLWPYVAGDNKAFKTVHAGGYVTNLIMLKQLGVIANYSDSILVELQVNGKTSRRKLAPSARPPQRMQFSSTLPNEGPASGPYFRRNPAQRYSLFYDSLNKVVYFNYKEIVDDDNFRITRVRDSIDFLVKNKPVDKLVIDIRSNGGGDLGTVYPIFNYIYNSPKLNQKGKTFLITGAQTFSAASFFLTKMELNTNAITVGQSSGARVNHFGDARMFNLPNSKFFMRLSAVYWQNALPSDNREAHIADYPLPYESRYFLSDTDPAYELILNFPAVKSTNTQVNFTPDTTKLFALNPFFTARFAIRHGQPVFQILEFDLENRIIPSLTAGVVSVQNNKILLERGLTIEAGNGKLVLTHNQTSYVLPEVTANDMARFNINDFDVRSFLSRTTAVWEGKCGGLQKLPTYQHVSRLANSYAKQKKNAEAILILEHVLQFNPTVNNYMLFLGDLYVSNNEPQKALRWYESAYEIAPNNQYAKDAIEKIRKPASSQNLPRRPLIGVSVSPITDSVKVKLQLETKNGGARIRAVVMGSTAHRAGLKSGDILISINNVPINSSDDVVNFARAYTSGDIQIQFLSDGRQKTALVPVTLFPNEKIAGAEVKYDAVIHGNSVLRSITTYPNGTAKLPAVYYIQGTGCSSIDFGLDTLNPQFSLIRHLTKLGFITFRIEKSGIGDSKGPGCSTIDFNTETEAFRKGLIALKADPRVDTSRIYIFGHSMGGVIAPMIAASNAVAGIIVYGTIVKPVAEYFVESRRMQTAPLELPADQAERFVRIWTKCSPLLFFSKDTTSLRQTYPECIPVFEALSFRSSAYWQQLAALDMPAIWRQYRGYVLSLWGERDVLADESDHKVLERIVNQYHKGKAVYQRVPQSTHELYRATSDQTAGYNGRVYNPAAVTMANEWIKTLGKTQTTAYLDFSDKEATLIFQEDGIESAYPRWIGSSDRILFQSNRTGNWQLYSINRRGQDLRRLTNDQSNNNFPDVSPDGRHITFVSDKTGNEEIYVMNADGSQIRKLTDDPERDIHPYFSPDGKKILFNSTRHSSGQNFDIYEVGIDGTGLRLVYANQNEKTCARYSPDLRSIVFLNGDPVARNDEVIVLDAITKKEKNISRSEAAEGWPVWSGTGREVIYSSDATGYYRLYRCDISSGKTTQLTASSLPHRDARASAHSRTGEILFNRQQRGTIGIYLLR